MNKRKYLVIVGVLLVSISIAISYYLYVQTTWVDSPTYQRTNTIPAKALVVVYSRTGNTFGAAKEAAGYFDADLLQIKAPQYAMTVEGQSLASDHADAQLTTTPIQHEAVDLSQYGLIVLCAPTWWFRPAVPLWSFVENHDFSGNHVFLMMTGNSRYKKDLTNPFEDMVEKQNGQFLDLLFIRRGRIYWQKTPEEVNQEIIEALDKRKDLWGLVAD